MTTISCAIYAAILMAIGAYIRWYQKQTLAEKLLSGKYSTSEDKWMRVVSSACFIFGLSLFIMGFGLLMSDVGVAISK